MSFQKCPICDGKGSVSDPYMTCSSVVCPTCRGARIIDELTGLPPTGGISGGIVIPQDVLDVIYGKKSTD